MKNTIESLISKDGTKINYRVIGSGPGLVILGGALQTSNDYVALADLLAHKYTLYIADRRGRNGSGPQGKDYSIKKECEDAIALLDKTRSKLLFGHSYGGIVALHLASQYPLAKLAIYEPPIFSLPTEWLEDFRKLLEKNDSIGALATMIKGAKLGGPLNYLPRPALKLLLKAVTKGEEREDAAKVLPTVVKEVMEIRKINAKDLKLGDIKTETLFLTGSKSHDYIHNDIDELKSKIKGSRRLVLQGMDHGSPNLKPQETADALKDFLL